MTSRLCILAILFILNLNSIAHSAAPPAVLYDLYGDPLPPGAVARMGSTRLSGLAPG
jgi:hypothetical protein